MEESARRQGRSIAPGSTARVRELWKTDPADEKESTMAEEKKKVSLARLLSLFIAFVGCVVVAVPILFPLANPVLLILLGSGVTVIALGVFLFFSI
jgi:uncharacterized RDD family membrane protein YckC